MCIYWRALFLTDPVVPSSIARHLQETSIVQLADVENLILSDMQRVDRFIAEQLQSDVVLIRQMGHYIVESGGKRLRPKLLLLAAAAAGYVGKQHIHMAAVVEFIHTATLLHDDVVDASQMRRGRESANAVWGNEAAVLVGDFLYSRAFELMVEVGSLRIMEIMAHTTSAIAEGEVLQLLHVHDPATSEQAYIEVIRRKTATLFQATCLIGGVLAELPAPQLEALRRYGVHLGTAFQIIDDVLDYSGASDEFGKNLGDDLSEGKPTLPLIVAMRNGNVHQAAMVRAAIESGGSSDLEPLLRTIEATGALDYARSLAQAEMDQACEALTALPASPAREGLMELARFAVTRSH